MQQTFDQGLIERIDYSKIGGKEQFLDGAIHECAVGTASGSTIYAFRVDAFPNEKPKRIEDFFNLKAFAGVRAVGKSPLGVIEMALIADGVAPQDVYSTLATDEGLERAIGKLNSIRRSISVFWKAGAQPPQLLSPLFIAIIVFAVGFFYLAARVGVVNSLGALTWAHIVLGLPFVIIVVTASLEGFDRDLVRAAQNLGAGPLTTFRRITLPLIAPGVLAGAIFVFLTSWDEIVTALFVAGGTENHTLPRRLWSGLREELSPVIIATATILSLLSIVPMTVVEALRARSAAARRSEKQ